MKRFNSRHFNDPKYFKVLHKGYAYVVRKGGYIVEARHTLEILERLPAIDIPYVFGMARGWRNLETLTKFFDTIKPATKVQIAAAEKGIYRDSWGIA